MVESKPKWRTGKPIRYGIYVVAIKVIGNAGIAGHAIWHPETGWNTDDEIIAYIPIQEIIQYADLDWPNN